MKRPASSICQTKRSGWRRVGRCGRCAGCSGGAAVSFVETPAGNSPMVVSAKWKVAASCSAGVAGGRASSCCSGGALSATRSSVRSDIDSLGCICFGAPSSRDASAGAVATASGRNATNNAVDAPEPRRSIEILPSPCAPSARPAASAVAPSGAAPRTARLSLPPSLARAVGVACSSSPPPSNSASGSSLPASRRSACSESERRLPAASVATTRIAGVPSASRIREQPHISAPPMRPPKPRSRSSRGAEPCGSVPASRAICSAAELFGIDGVAGRARWMTVR